jgi:hypothetical protein
MTDKQTTPTPASAWRKAREQGELIKLPGSGNVARLVRPPLASMVLTNGGAPNPLSRNVQRLLAGTAPPKDEADRWESYKKNTRALQEIAALCLAEPKLILDRAPGDDEIGPDDLAEQDYLFIYYNWLEGAAEAVAPFRVTAGL